MRFYRGAQGAPFFIIKNLLAKHRLRLSVRGNFILPPKPNIPLNGTYISCVQDDDWSSPDILWISRAPAILKSIPPSFSFPDCRNVRNPRRNFPIAYIHWQSLLLPSSMHEFDEATPCRTIAFLPVRNGRVSDKFGPSGQIIENRNH